MALDDVTAVEVVTKVYHEARKFLEQHSAPEIMASGKPWLIQRYESYKEIVEGFENLMTDRYYRYLLL